jgi:TetR/AcrR family transcriptional regulator, tetracycline repressor protein
VATNSSPVTAATRPGRRRSSTQHAGVTRDDVVDTALAIVAGDGGDALTMRGLAARLGVAPTTVYWHVGNRDELVLAVVRRQAEHQAGSDVTGTTPAERIQSAATNIWRNALTHRNVTALANEAGATTLLELPLEVALVAELEAAGIHGRAARDALRSLLAVIAGCLVIAWGRGQQVPEHLRTASLWAEVDDARLGADTRAALCERGDGDDDAEAIVATTIRAVVAALLAATPTAATQIPHSSTARTGQEAPR